MKWDPLRTGFYGMTVRTDGLLISATPGSPWYGFWIRYEEP